MFRLLPVPGRARGLAVVRTPECSEPTLGNRQSTARDWGCLRAVAGGRKVAAAPAIRGQRAASLYGVADVRDLWSVDNPGRTQLDCFPFGEAQIFMERLPGLLRPRAAALHLRNVATSGLRDTAEEGQHDQFRQLRPPQATGPSRWRPGRCASLRDKAGGLALDPPLRSRQRQLPPAAAEDRKSPKRSLYGFRGMPSDPGPH